MDGLKLWPWENGAVPFWTNQENGYKWYLDEGLTAWCTRTTIETPPLNAVCFVVAHNKEPIARVLMDKDTNKVLGDETSLEGMACKIDALRLKLYFDEKDTVHYQTPTKHNG